MALRASESPILNTFLDHWLKNLDPKDRATFEKRLLPKVKLAHPSIELDRQRSLRCLDWLVREYVPAFLDLHPKLQVHSSKHRSMGRLVDGNSAALASTVIEMTNEDIARARFDARDAADEIAEDRNFGSTSWRQDRGDLSTSDARKIPETIAHTLSHDARGCSAGWAAFTAGRELVGSSRAMDIWDSTTQTRVMLSTSSPIDAIVYGRNLQLQARTVAAAAWDKVMGTSIGYPAERRERAWKAAAEAAADCIYGFLQPTIREVQDSAALLVEELSNSKF